jgi:hypothetical protein
LKWIVAGILGEAFRGRCFAWLFESMSAERVGDSPAVTVLHADVQIVDVVAVIAAVMGAFPP